MTECHTFYNAIITKKRIDELRLSIKNITNPMQVLF